MTYAERFGWWWCDPSAPKKCNPAKALRRMFPNKSEEEIRKYYWPELVRAAFNYELASRWNKPKKYLIDDKPFNQLPREQMLAVVKLWPRERQLQGSPIRFLPYVEAADLDGHPVMEIYQLARKRAQKDMKAAERSYAQIAGWTMLQYFQINLAQFSNREIVKAFEMRVDAERNRLNIPEPIPEPKDRQRFSFQEIEVLDNGSDKERQARRARKKARKLIGEWAKWGGPEKWAVELKERVASLQSRKRRTNK